LGFVNNVVVDKRRGVDDLDNRRELYRAIALVTEKLGGEQQQRWTDSLSAAGAAAGDTLAVLFTGVACRNASNVAINVTSPSCRLGYTGTINPNQFKASQLTRIPVSYGATVRQRFDALLALMRNGTAHVNIHNKASPNGIIRGQIQPM